jgi:hypothetical protein
VDHPLRPFSAPVPPSFWRSAAVVASLVAIVELVLLVVTGTALLIRHGNSTPARHEATPAPVTRTQPRPAPHRTRAVAAPAPTRARGLIGVMVLNGNGRQGAAAAAAARVRRHGYRIRSVGNAGTTSYPHSIVMYRSGYEGEGRRLARDLGIRMVGPLDGMRPAQLHGAQTVVVIGS